MSLGVTAAPGASASPASSSPAAGALAVLSAVLSSSSSGVEVKVIKVINS